MIRTHQMLLAVCGLVTPFMAFAQSFAELEHMMGFAIALMFMSGLSLVLCTVMLSVIHLFNQSMEMHASGIAGSLLGVILSWVFGDYLFKLHNNEAVTLATMTLFPPFLGWLFVVVNNKFLPKK